MTDIKYESMDDDDIKYYLPKAKIILYNQLKKYKNIEQLLKKHGDYIILLYPVSSEMSGHWVSLNRYNPNIIEYFDSYGLKPDVPFTWTTSNFRNNKRYLTELLNTTKLRINYNTIPFQSKKDKEISTCGAFVVFKILTLKEYNADLNENNKMLKTLKDLNEDMTYDDIVVDFIKHR
jgi:hypothetical protein